MRPLFRKPVNKARSSRKFRAHGTHTKAANMAMPMRGGWRL